MFSGIVQNKCPITFIERLPGLCRLTIDLGELAQGAQLGASISVSGVCLTATNIESSKIQFELIQETLDKTNLGELHVGDFVNIERSVKVGDELGGHRVSGHVMGTALIRDIQTPLHNHILTLGCEPAWMEYILPKGFIALDGCSLTVVGVGPDWFTVHLIPETLRITTFETKGVDGRINLELDPETQAIVSTVKTYLHTHLPRV